MSAIRPWVHTSQRSAVQRRDEQIAAEDRKQSGRLCQELRRTEMSQRKIRAGVAAPLGDDGVAVLERAKRRLRS
jgi:hypothetical protein